MQEKWKVIFENVMISEYTDFKDEHTYGEKMARKGRNKVIYKVIFISKTVFKS